MLRRVPRQLLLILFVLLIVGPLSLVLFTSLKTTAELYASPLAPPASFAPTNYRDLLDSEAMFLYFRNSFIVTLFTVALVLWLGSMLAYAIARLRGWAATVLFGFFVAGLMVAPQVYMIPLFLIVNALGLMNTIAGVVVVTVAFELPVAVLILTGFIRGIPRDILDAAFVDGATEWNVYRHIVVPLAAPAFATLAIFALVITWNDLLFPLLFLKTDSVKTLPLALLSFRGEYLTNYPLLFAGVVTATVPIIVAYLFLQRYFVEGMTAGATKG